MLSSKNLCSVTMISNNQNLPKNNNLINTENSSKAINKVWQHSQDPTFQQLKDSLKNSPISMEANSLIAMKKVAILSRKVQ